MFDFFEEKDVDQIYAYEMLQKFAFGLIGIFIPIHIAMQTSSLQLVFLYLIGFSFVFLVSAFPVSYLIARIGFKHSMILSYSFLLPGILMLYRMPVNETLIMAVASLIGVGKSLHFIPLHAEFAVDTTQKNRGKASGKLIGLPRAARALAPFIGGAILASFGFNFLALVSIFFALISVYPLLKSKDHRDPLEYDIRSLFDKKHFKFGSLFFLRGVEIAAAVYLFPLYVYYVVGGSINVGAVSSLGSIGSAVFTILVGRVTDRIEEKHMISLGLVVSSLFFVLRVYVSTPLEAFVISFVSGIIAMMYVVPIFSFLADSAEKEDVLEFYAFREFMLNLGKISAYLIALYVIIQGDILSGFNVGFLIAGTGLLLMFLTVRSLEI